MLYPAAFGHPATVPAMFGWLVEWLINCLAVGCQHPPGWGPNAPTRWPNPIKMLPKILQNGGVGGSWGPLLGVLGALGELLGGSWGHLGPKMAPRWPQEAPRPRKINSGAPSWEPSWRPKSIKNPSRGHRKGDRFFDHFWDRLLERFGANLAPTWLPKPFQNGAKLVPKSMQVGMLICESCF